MQIVAVLGWAVIAIVFAAGIAFIIEKLAKRATENAKD